MQVKFADSSKAPSSRATRRGAALAPALRLGFYLTAACLVGFSLLLHSVRADVTEALWGVGAKAMEYPGTPREDVRHLRLNGARVSFRTQTIDAPLDQVLSHYEALCEGRDAGLADQLRAVATRAARNQHAGYVACLDMGDAPQDLGALAERFRRFSETGDLRELGDLRYVFARRAAGSSTKKTFLLTLWAGSAIDLSRMLPRAGADAAGRDLAGVPRPPGSQRILSVWEEGQPSGVFVYRVMAETADELEAFYRSELPRHGWTLIERHPSETIEVDGIHMLFVERDGRLATLLFHSEGASPTVLTILASEPS